MLERTLSDLAALPALALMGIFEPPPAAERESDDAEGIMDDGDAAAAARCAPSFAMMREREIRGLRADGCCCCFCWPPVVVGLRSGLAERAKAAAATASEVGRTGGGTAISGVLNILLACAPRGLFVIASRAAELRGGVLARCATMLLVRDLATVEEGLRVLARELAVGANSLDVAVDLLGLNMLAVALLLPSAVLSSCALFAGLGPGAGGRCEPADSEFVADERGRPFVPMDEALLAEPASTLRRELVDDAGMGFVNSADRGFVGALLDTDTVRVGAILFRLGGAPDGRDAGREGFFGGPGFAS
jgi:hypothetical protein